MSRKLTAAVLRGLAHWISPAPNPKWYAYRIEHSPHMIVMPFEFPKTTFDPTPYPWLNTWGTPSRFSVFGGVS